LKSGIDARAFRGYPFQFMRKLLMPLCWLCATYPAEVTQVSTTIFMIGLVGVYYAFGLQTLLIIVGCMIVLGFWVEGHRPVPIPPEMFGDGATGPPDGPPLLPSPTEQRFIAQQRRYGQVNSPPVETSPAVSDRSGSAVRPPPAGHRW
jgi:hypothetical protein